MTHDLLNPADFSPEVLERLLVLLEGQGRLALVDEGGNRVELPASMVDFLSRVVHLLEEQRTVMVIPEDEELTTQAAADYLGVSRQFLVNLLEAGEIPFYKVGTHRRVKFCDLFAYEKKRDEQRRQALDDITTMVSEAGLYDGSYTGDG